MGSSPLRLALQNVGPQLFEEWSAEDFYGLGKINRSSRAWLQDFTRTHASFARKCLPVHPSSPRWEGLTKSVVERLDDLPYTVTTINLRGCVSPASLKVLKGYRFHRFELPNVLLGALPGDSALLYGLGQLPLSCRYGVPDPVSYVFCASPPPEPARGAEEEEPPTAVFKYSNCFTDCNYVGWFSPTPLSDDPPTDFASGYDCLLVKCALRNTDRTSSEYSKHTFDPPFDPRPFPSIKTLVLIDVLPDNFNEINEAITSLDFLGNMLDANPMIESVSMVHYSRMNMMLLSIQPYTDEEIAEKKEREVNPPVGWYTVRIGYGGCYLAHRRLRSAWERILKWKDAKDGRVLKMLFTHFYDMPADNRSRCFIYGGEGWPAMQLIPH